MEKIDVRKDTGDPEEAGGQLEEKGIGFVEIGGIIGVRRQTVSGWRKSCPEAGAEGLKPKKKGNRSERIVS